MCFKYIVLHFYCDPYRGLTTKNLVSICHSKLGFCPPLTACQASLSIINSGSDGKESTCNAGDPSSTPGLERSLEKGMSTHSSILAWRIPWTEEPVRLQPMGSQRVRDY